MIKVRYGGEKVKKDEFVTIDVVEKEYDSEAKFQYWDYKQGSWISVNDSTFTKNNSTYKWKPSGKILIKKNLRIRILDSENKIIYMSPAYILEEKVSKAKLVFETEVESITNSFNIFPNPIKDKTINIVSEKGNTEIQNLNIIDLSGNMIFEVNNIVINNNYNIHLPNISRGVYIVQIRTEENIESKKIIIE